MDVSVRTRTSLVGVKFKPTAGIRTSDYPLVYCWKCGSELREDAAFCWKCGASVRGTMGVQSPTGFELLRHDRNVQNHWARRLIAYIIDVALVTGPLDHCRSYVDYLPHRYRLPFRWDFPGRVGGL